MTPEVSADSSSIHLTSTSYLSIMLKPTVHCNLSQQVGQRFLGHWSAFPKWMEPYIRHASHWQCQSSNMCPISWVIKTYRIKAVKCKSLQECNSYQKWNSHLKIFSAVFSLCFHSMSYKKTAIPGKTEYSIPSDKGLSKDKIPGVSWLQINQCYSHITEGIFRILLL